MSAQIPGGKEIASSCDGRVSSSHCRRPCRMGHVVVVFGRYNLPHSIFGWCSGVKDALSISFNLFSEEVNTNVYI